MKKTRQVWDYLLGTLFFTNTLKAFSISFKTNCLFRDLNNDRTISARIYSFFKFSKDSLCFIQNGLIPY